MSAVSKDRDPGSVTEGCCPGYQPERQGPRLEVFTGLGGMWTFVRGMAGLVFGGVPRMCSTVMTRSTGAGPLPETYAHAAPAETSWRGRTNSESGCCSGGPVAGGASWGRAWPCASTRTTSRPPRLTEQAEVAREPSMYWVMTQPAGSGVGCEDEEISARSEMVHGRVPGGAPMSGGAGFATVTGWVSLGFHGTTAAGNGPGARTTVPFWSRTTATMTSAATANPAAIIGTAHRCQRPRRSRPEASEWLRPPEAAFWISRADKPTGGGADAATACIAARTRSSKFCGSIITTSLPVPAQWPAPSPRIPYASRPCRG